MIIPNPSRLKQKLDMFRREGVDKLDIVSDFDNTLNIKDYRGKCYDTSVGVLKHVWNIL